MAIAVSESPSGQMSFGCGPFGQSRTCPSTTRFRRASVPRLTRSVRGSGRDRGDLVPPSEERRLPRWVVPAVVVFWGGFLGALAVRFVWSQLSGLFVLVAIAVFLALAIEPGVNRLARRGWRRGSATALILFGVMALFLCSSARSARSSARRSPTCCRTPRRTSPTPSRRSTTRSARTSTPRRSSTTSTTPTARSRSSSGPAGQRRAAVGRRARRPAAAVLRAAVHLLPRRRRPEDAPRHLQPTDARRARSACCGAGSWPATRPAATSTPRPAGPDLGGLPLDRVPVPRHRRAGGAGAVGRHRQPVPARRRHVPRRHAARCC